MQRIKIGVTFDHRYIDGDLGAKVARHFSKVFENPEKFMRKKQQESLHDPN